MSVYRPSEPYKPRKHCGNCRHYAICFIRRSGSDCYLRNWQRPYYPSELKKAGGLMSGDTLADTGHSGH